MSDLTILEGGAAGANPGGGSEQGGEGGTAPAVTPPAGGEAGGAGEPGAAAVPGGEGGDWLAGLPEDLREIAAKTGSMENLRGALERGVSYVPLASADEISITAPEGMELNESGVAWFKDLAVKEGLTQKQASALVERYNAEFIAAGERQQKAALNNLKTHYGEEFDSKMAVAHDGAKKLDELSGGALGKVLKMGLGNHEDFIKAMVTIGESISDSVLPGVSQGGGDKEAMTTTEFIADIFKQGKE